MVPSLTSLWEQMRSLKCLYPLFTGVVLESQLLRLLAPEKPINNIQGIKIKSTFFSFMLSLVSLAPRVLRAEVMHTAPLQTRVLSVKQLGQMLSLGSKYRSAAGHLSSGW